MRHKAEPAPDKISTMVLYPGCHGEVVAVSWRKSDSLFQSCDCPTCSVSWGRVNGGLWHSLGVFGAGRLENQPPSLGTTEVKQNIRRG